MGSRDAGPGGKLSKRFWLTAPDEIERRVNGVTNHLRFLEGARRLRDRLSSAAPADVLQGRSDADADREQPGGASTGRRGARESPDRIGRIRGLAEGASSRDAVEQHRALASLASIEDPGCFQPAHIQVFTRLKTGLDTVLGTAPATPADVEDAYLTYAKLKTLWAVKDDDPTFQQCEQAESLVTFSSSRE